MAHLQTLRQKKSSSVPPFLRSHTSRILVSVPMSRCETVEIRIRRSKIKEGRKGCSVVNSEGTSSSRQPVRNWTPGRNNVSRIPRNSRGCTGGIGFCSSCSVQSVQSKTPNRYFYDGGAIKALNRVSMVPKGLICG